MTKPLRLGVAGIGVVGAGLTRLLQRQGNALAVRGGRPIVLAAYSARRRRDGRPEIGDARFTDNAVQLAAEEDIDAFVELIGGADGVAFEAVKAALRRGLPVVTANKAMLAEHGLELAALSEAHDAPLFYEAAVGGGIPVIKTLRESLAGNAIERVSGILNGTCNYILSRMETEKPAVRSLPRRGAAARLRRGRSDLRRRRFRHGPQTRHPRLARLRFEDRRLGRFGGGNRDRSPSPTSPQPTNWASASSCSASPSGRRTASNSASTRPWWRKNRPSPRRWAS